VGNNIQNDQADLSFLRINFSGNLINGTL